MGRQYVCNNHASVQDREAQIQVRYDQVKKDGEKIHELIKEVYKLNSSHYCSVESDYLCPLESWLLQGSRGLRDVAALP